MTARKQRPAKRPTRSTSKRKPRKPSARTRPIPTTKRSALDKAVGQAVGSLGKAMATGIAAVEARVMDRLSKFADSVNAERAAQLSHAKTLQQRAERMDERLHAVERERIVWPNGRQEYPRCAFMSLPNMDPRRRDERHQCQCIAGHTGDHHVGFSHDEWINWR